VVVNERGEEGIFGVYRNLWQSTLGRDPVNLFLGFPLRQVNVKVIHIEQAPAAAIYRQRKFDLQSGQRSLSYSQ
jgi:hypothetical protein